MVGELGAFPGVAHLHPSVPGLGKIGIQEKWILGKLALSFPFPFPFPFLFLYSFPFLGFWFGLNASRLLPRCFPSASRFGLW